MVRNMTSQWRTYDYFFWLRISTNKSVPVLECDPSRHKSLQTLKWSVLGPHNLTRLELRVDRPSCSRNAALTLSLKPSKRGCPILFVHSLTNSGKRTRHEITWDSTVPDKAWFILSLSLFYPSRSQNSSTRRTRGQVTLGSGICAPSHFLLFTPH